MTSDEQRHGKAAEAFAAKAGAEQRERDDRHHQGRERELDVGGAGHDRIHPAPGIAGQKPERDADRRLDGDGKHADDERDARAVEDGAEEIAALRVGAEQEARIAPSSQDGGSPASSTSKLVRSNGFCGAISGASVTATAIAPSMIAASAAARPLGGQARAARAGRFAMSSALIASPRG